jgi:uncharacterized SAM-binding protein YcdF (DUF218 family)
VSDLLTTLKWHATPGSIPFLLACCGFALVLRFAWPRQRRIARAWLAAVFGTYLLISLPFVANAIAAALPPLRSSVVQPGQPVGTLVAFDGDNRRGRVAESKRVYDLTKPKTVWIVGNAWMWDAMWKSGVPYNSIKHADNAVTTREQALWVRRFMAGPHDEPVVILASRLQMPRVEALAEAEGVNVLLAPSPVDDEPATTGLWKFIPTYFALRISRDAIYEHAALRYYRWNGWIR